MAGFPLFLGRRLLEIAVLAWAVTVAAFVLFRVAVVGQLADVEINSQLGAGEPDWVQYFHYLQHLLHGNLGATETVGLSVDELLWRALAPTLSLVIGGMVLWLAAGIVAGLVSGLRPGSLADRAITATGPARWLGRMILPWIALAAAQAGLTARLIRASVMEASAQDYIRTAQAKGLSRQRIAWVHVLRPAAVKDNDLMVIMGTILATSAPG